MYFILSLIIIFLIIYVMFLESKVVKLRKDFEMFSSVSKHNTHNIFDCVCNHIERLDKEISRKVSIEDITRLIDEVIKEDKRISKKGKERIKNTIKKEINK